MCVAFFKTGFFSLILPWIVCASLFAQQPTTESLSDMPGTSVADSDQLQLARGLMDQDHFAEAEDVLRHYLAADEHSGKAHELLAYSLLRQNKPGQALPEYTRAAALEMPTSHMLEQVAQAYILLDDLTDADHWSLRAVQLDPKDPNAWYGLGRVRQTEQRFADAVSCFQHVLELVPRSVKAENNLGLAYEDMDKLDEAAAAYKQAIAWQQNVPESGRSEQPLLNLAVLDLHAGKVAEAEPLLTEAVRISPKDSSIHEQLGHFYLQQNKINEAQREFTTACELDPGSGRLHFLLGQADKRLGWRQEAAEQFSFAARLTEQEARRTVPGSEKGAPIGKQIPDLSQ